MWPQYRRRLTQWLCDLSLGGHWLETSHFAAHDLQPADCCSAKASRRRAARASQRFLMNYKWTPPVSRTWPRSLPTLSNDGTRPLAVASVPVTQCGSSAGVLWCIAILLVSVVSCDETAKHRLSCTQARSEQRMLWKKHAKYRGHRLGHYRLRMSEECCLRHR